MADLLCYRAQIVTLHREVIAAAALRNPLAVNLHGATSIRRAAA